MALECARSKQMIDLQRLGLLHLAVQEMSANGYVLFQHELVGKRRQKWRVTVRIEHPTGCQCMGTFGCIGIGEHTEMSDANMLIALDRAVQWLRIAQQEFRALEGRTA